ncbi:MAG: hypothetical protein U1E47_02930 [Rivihabitans pingtungensis]
MKWPALKADFATQHIPVVFMTGLTETEHVVAAFAAGGADYVTKPLRPQEVLARIAAHMHNARQMKQARTALDALARPPSPSPPPAASWCRQTALARDILHRRHFAEPGDYAPSACWPGPATPSAARRAGQEARPWCTPSKAAACWRLFTTRPATKNGWWCCAKKTTTAPWKP